MGKTVINHCIVTRPDTDGRHKNLEQILYIFLQRYQVSLGMVPPHWHCRVVSWWVSLFCIDYDLGTWSDDSIVTLHNISNIIQYLIPDKGNSTTKWKTWKMLHFVMVILRELLEVCNLGALDVDRLDKKLGTNPNTNCVLHTYPL